MSRCASRGIVDIDSASAVGMNRSRGSQERDYKDRIFHGFPAVGSAQEIITARVVGRDHACISRVAVDTSWSWPIPVDELVGLDIVIDRGSAGFERGDEGLRDLKPSFMGPIDEDSRVKAKSQQERRSEKKRGLHIIDPFRSPIVGVLR